MSYLGDYRIIRKSWHVCRTNRTFHAWSGSWGMVGGGYFLKCPALVCTGRLLLKRGRFIWKGGILLVELFERVGKSAAVNKKYMNRIKNDFKKYSDCKYSKVVCFSALSLGSRLSSAAKDHIEPECAFEVCSDSCNK